MKECLAEPSTQHMIFVGLTLLLNYSESIRQEPSLVLTILITKHVANEPRCAPPLLNCGVWGHEGKAEKQRFPCQAP